MCTETSHLYKRCRCHKTIIHICPFQEAAEGHGRHRFEDPPGHESCRNFKIEKEDTVEGCCEMAEGGRCPYERQNIAGRIDRSEENTVWDADGFYNRAWS